MKFQSNRRQFLKQLSIVAATATGTRIIGAPNILAERSPNSKLGCVVIGCGGQGIGTHVTSAVRERLLAIVDVDEKRFPKALKKAQDIEHDLDTADVRTFTDYRKMFDTMAKEIDAVFIATPNHQHALPALMAMKMGKAVYVEKPLCYDIAEARQMADFAKRYKVVTQMGNQGHSGEGYRRLCEYIWAGAIGNVTEVHSWTNRANGGIGPRPPTEPVPDGMHWDEWIGPAPYREFHSDLHPHEWHGWHDFGNGSLGNMGCHVLDGAFWALKLGYPKSIEVEDVMGGTNERYPVSTRIRWDFPAREGMSPVKVFWYDGKKRGTNGTADETDAPGSVKAPFTNKPPLFLELSQKYNDKFENSGSLFVGDKGIMFTGTYGGGVRLVPDTKMKEYPVPDKKIPRIKGSHTNNFLEAIKTGGKAVADFDYSSRLTEMILLGCLAIKAGKGHKIEWDGPNMQCTNLLEVNRHLKRDYRKGWEV